MNKTVFEHLENYHNTDKLMGEILESHKNSKFSTVSHGAISRSQWYKFDVNTRDLMKSPNDLYHVDFNFEFIPRAHRLEFRNSIFYGKMISLTTIMKNYNLFELVPIVFIDGLMYTNFYIEAHEDMTSLIFKTFAAFPTNESVDRLRDGFSKAEMKTMVESELDMTVYFIPSMSRYTRKKMTRATMVNYLTTNTPLIFEEPFEAHSTLNNPFDISNGDGSMALISTTIEDKKMYKYKPFLISDKLLVGDEIPLSVLRPDLMTNTIPWVTIMELRNVSIFDFRKRTHSLQDPQFGSEPYEVLNTNSMMVFKVVTTSSGSDTVTNMTYVHNPNITVHYPQLMRCDEPMDSSTTYIAIVPVTLFEGDVYVDYK